MKKLIILFFLASCVSPNSNVGTNKTKLNFNDDLTFDEFSELLIQYAKTSPYPNINQ
tara:strand:+ start:143 stop:313 length:171 start_codon:yes stop_codon:yes gene_type:complete